VRNFLFLTVAVLCWCAGASAADPDSAPQQFDPLTVHPNHQDDPLFESDRKLHDLMKDMPCLGCAAQKPQESTLKSVGKFLLQEITPMTPEERDDDPPPGPVNLDPDEVSKGKPGGKP
jgi:hypothetical protein